MSHRSTEGGEHEGSRRMKTELLIQIDGLAKSDDHVFLLAASNLPWDLDMAMLRRLEKRILIDVPDFDARRILFQQLFSSIDEQNEGLKSKGIDYDELAKVTEGYSGSDINLVCREAAMRPLRSLFDILDSDSPLGSESLQDLYMTQNDVLEAIKTTKSSSDNSFRQKYNEWQEEFGSV
jgi:katanin p60 ATPase-containing subunit A1